MDLTQLLRQLEHASFSARGTLAEAAARALSPAELDALTAGLGNEHASVRLGVIEVLRCAKHRDGLRALLAHATSRDGDERVFAIRALAQLARPEDDYLADAARQWLASRDAFVEAQATHLARALGMPVASAAPAPPAAAAAPAVEPKPPAPAAAGAAPRPDAPRDQSLEKLVAGLLAATTAGERMSLVAAIERHGPQPLAAAARVLLPKANADTVALLCRALIRQAEAIAQPERVVPGLESAVLRLASSPIASAALDDALVALGGLAKAGGLLSRIGDMDRRQLEAVMARLCATPAAEVALHVPRLLDALAHDLALWPVLGPVLVYTAAHLRESTRVELRRVCELALGELRRGKPLEPITLVMLCWVLAKVAAPGDPLSRHLRGELDRLHLPEAARALCALCGRLATEEAAGVILGMLSDPLPEAREAAREAVAAWQSPWVQLTAEPAPAITTSYTDEHGVALVRRGDKLVVPTSGEEYVLDLRGRPVRAGETEHGGCLCCAPPRALIRRRKEGVRCPSSGEVHLRDGARLMFEREHPVGGCRVCDSARPRVRDGARVICLDCGAGAGELVAQLAPDQPAVPSEHAGRSHEEPLPKPPTAAELEHIAPHIRTAICANVFLQGRDGQDSWNGSGIIIARDGNHLAILTNRHVVESDETRRLCALKALTVTGEQRTATTVWRARRGIDLALVEVTVERPEAIGVMALGTGAVLVGSPVFAIGNPLGLAWSYTGGTLSAIRHWTTQEGQSVRILQTDAPIAPGSSGGGLFHGDGHLLGVMSFLRQGHAGGSAHFALSIEAIREAFARDEVRWRGRALAELSA